MLKLIDGNKIKPEGWLKRQLEIQAEGLSGNLHKFWPDIKDSAWIGGDRDGWERVPYWLDGFIPLAWLLDDEELKATAVKYVNAILDRQQDDGWICPCAPEARPGYDPWAYLLIGKVLALYCGFTGDKRAEEGLRRAMHCLHDLLKDGTVKLFNWGKFRWFEGLVPLIFLNRIKPEAWIAETGRILREQGADYPSFCEMWKKPLAVWKYETHIVNIGMMLKYEALCAELFGEEYTDKASELIEVLDRYNGNAVGTFNGDECLAGDHNNQGFELCSVTEMMYSLEILYRFTGNTKYADRLELVAFNALPATFTDDMRAHQYDQMVNQIECVPFRGKSFFGTNGSEAHIFGLEPNYGCCTANMHQGWPKLAMNVFHVDDEDDSVITASMILPASVTFRPGNCGHDVKIRCDTGYPFGNTAAYTVNTRKPVDFTLKIRVPAGTSAVDAEGRRIRSGGKFLTFKRTWKSGDKIVVNFEIKPKFEKRPYGLDVVRAGNIVFSLPLSYETSISEYERNGVERKYPFCDYHLKRTSEWKYGFADRRLELKLSGPGQIPFSADKPGASVSADLCPADWDYALMYDSVADYRPRTMKALGKPRKLRLVPYGAAKLRMTEMPVVRQER